MAHELDTKANGVAAYFGRKPAWHQLGTVMDEDVTVPQALELSGADFKVSTEPLYTRVVIDTQAGTELYSATEQQKADDDERETVEQFRDVDGSRAVVRLDRGDALGVVGSRYTPLQNADAFGVLEPLVDSGLARIETAGVLRGGVDVWMLVRFDVESDIVKEAFKSRTTKDGGEDGGIIPYGLISNNHAGRRQVQLMETPIRVVCANTLGAAHSSFGMQKRRGRAFQVRHTLNVGSRTTEAARVLFTDLVANMETIARQYELLRRTHLDREAFERLVLDVAAPLPAKLDRAGLTSREETSRAQITAVRDELTRLWVKGDGHTGDASAWEAYNGVTQSVDHDASLWRVRGTGDARLTALFEGRLATVKQETLDALVGHASASKETEAWRASLGGEWNA